MWRVCSPGPAGLGVERVAQPPGHGRRGGDGSSELAWRCAAARGAWQALTVRGDVGAAWIALGMLMDELVLVPFPPALFPPHVLGPSAFPSPPEPRALPAASTLDRPASIGRGVGFGVRSRAVRPLTDQSAERAPGAAAASALRTLVMAGVGVVLGLVAADLLDRLRPDPAGEAAAGVVLTLDRELGWTHRPGFAAGGVSTDGLGLRGRGFDGTERADEVRVLVAGASDVFGLGEDDDDLWAPELARLLAPRADPPPRVLNGAVQGYSIVQCCRRVMRLLPIVEPDLVLVTVTPGRQGLVDTSPAPAWTRVGGRMVPTDLVDPWPDSLRAVPAALHAMLESSSLYRRRRARARFSAGVSAELVHYVLTDAPVPLELAEPLEQVAAEIGALVAYARELRVELRFVVLTGAIATNEGAWSSYLRDAASAGAPPPGTPMTEPLDALARLVEGAGGAVWQMQSTLFEMGADWDRTVNTARHWSPLGHRRVAVEWDRLINGDGLLDTLVERRRGAPRSAASPPSSEGLR